MSLNELLERVKSAERATVDPEIELEGRIMLRLFLKKEPLLVEEIFPLLQELSNSSNFEKNWIGYYQTHIEAEKAEVLRDAAECKATGADERFYLAELPLLEIKASINSFSALRDFLHSSGSGTQGTLDCFANEYTYMNEGEDGREYIVANYFWFVLGDFLYKQHVSMAATFELFCQATALEVERLYAQIEINLAKRDQQFAKYGLLTYNENFSISVSKQERAIIDKRLSGKRFIVDVPRELMQSIESAVRIGYVSQLAFRVNLIRDLAMSFEAREYGSLFSFDSMSLPETTRLYEDAYYENSLWISVDKEKSSLTFEELLDNFSELEDRVVTQVVHLELAEEGGKSLISHIDHEYIMYSLLEYAERQRSGNVKGYRKLKTFKIDRARIPFSDKLDGRYFLYTVLDAYFVRKALLREYFENVLGMPH